MALESSSPERSSVKKYTTSSYSSAKSRAAAAKGKEEAAGQFVRMSTDERQRQVAARRHAPPLLKWFTPDRAEGERRLPLLEAEARRRVLDTAVSAKVGDDCRRDAGSAAKNAHQFNEMSTPACAPHGSKCARLMSNSVDRLSSLPDALLHHVMSFLPMPEVVRTSLLSPRWRNLWASTPFIHIDYQDFMNDKHDLNELSVEDKLEKFGDHLLLLRDGTVPCDEARIFIGHGPSNKSFVWIRHAIKHKARLLHVYGVHSPAILDSSAMFPSQHLKKVRLQGISLADGFFRTLNHDCPALEHLELEGCIVQITSAISSRSLKVLLVSRCSIYKNLLICARNLIHLSIIDPSCACAIVPRDLSSLVAASVSLRSGEFHDNGDTILEHHILDGLAHATTLELYAPLPELAFGKGMQTCPVFSSLGSLVLGEWCMAAEFYPLICFLQRSPVLKELSFKLRREQCGICKEGESALSPRETLSGNYPHIERVRIYCKMMKGSVHWCRCCYR